MQGVHLSHGRFISCFSGRQKMVRDSFLHQLILKQLQFRIINMSLWQILGWPTLSPKPEYLPPAWGLKRMKGPYGLRPSATGTASWRGQSWLLSGTWRQGEYFCRRGNSRWIGRGKENTAHTENCWSREVVRQKRGRAQSLKERHSRWRHNINWLEPTRSEIVDKSASTRPWASVDTHCNTSAC